MHDIRETLGNATMAHTNMNIKTDTRKVVKNIFDIIEENREGIEKANEIDIKNNNGFKLDFEIINKIKNEIDLLGDVYRKVISMKKNENNYIEGKQTDNLGTICLIYDGNTYCLLEIILKAILTHNSIIATSETDYMKATNELILILIHRILEAYEIDKNLIQIIYTSRLEQLLSNSISINKVIVIGDRNFQDKIKEMSQIEVISKGYNNFDIYIDNLQNIELIEKLMEKNKNIDVYISKGLKISFDNYIEVEDINEAISQINFNTSGYSSSIFTDNNQAAMQFLREIKSDNISVNSSPLIKDSINIDINIFLKEKSMIYPNPLNEGLEKNKIEFPTAKTIFEKNKNDKKQKENLEIKEDNKRVIMQLEQKDIEISDLKRQLYESQDLANKYINICKKSFLTRLFGNLKKEDIEKDTKLLSLRENK